jgi:hypothetical protein
MCLGKTTKDWFKSFYQEIPKDYTVFQSGVEFDSNGNSLDYLFLVYYNFNNTYKVYNQLGFGVLHFVDIILAYFSWFGYF